MSFYFWQKWLVGVSIYHVVFGVLLAFFSQSQFMYVLLNQYFDPIFWPDNQISAGTMQYKNWVSRVLGAVVASWGILIAFIAYYPLNCAKDRRGTASLLPLCFGFLSIRVVLSTTMFPLMQWLIYSHFFCLSYLCFLLVNTFTLAKQYENKILWV